MDRRVLHARSFRQNPTEAERKLWQGLQKLPRGFSHMRRQAPIGPYFADFTCRTDRVLRSWNNDVLNNMDGVLDAILAALQPTSPTPNPSPPQARGEGD